MSFITVFLLLFLIRVLLALTDVHVSEQLFQFNDGGVFFARFPVTTVFQIAGLILQISLQQFPVLLSLVLFSFTDSRFAHGFLDFAFFYVLFQLA